MLDKILDSHLLNTYLTPISLIVALFVASGVFVFINRKSISLKLFDGKKSIVWISALFFLFVLLFNIMTPFIADDWDYSQREGIANQVQGVLNDYQYFNSRIFGQFFGTFFLGFPKIVFDIVNSVMYLALSLLLFFLSSKKNEKSNGLKLLLIHLMIWIFVPVQGQVFFWTMGATNYLWMFVFFVANLGFLHLVFEYDFKPKRVILWSLLTLVLGVLSGWSNENVGLLACLVNVLVLVLLFVKKQKKTLYLWTQTFGAVAGYLLMMFAPGVTERQEAYASTTFIDKFLTNLPQMLQLLVTDFSGILLLFIFLLILQYKRGEVESCKKSFIVFLASGLSYFTLLAAPPETLWTLRAFFAPVLLLILAICLLIQVEKMPRFALIISAFLLVVFLIQSSFGVLDVYRSGKNVAQRDQWVVEQQNMGNKNPVVPRVYGQIRTSYFAGYRSTDIKFNEPKDWPNTIYTTKFKLDSVNGVDRVMWNLEYKDGDTEWMKIQKASEYLSKIKNDKNIKAYVFAIGSRGQEWAKTVEHTTFEMATIQDGKLEKFSSKEVQVANLKLHLSFVGEKCVLENQWKNDYLKYSSGVTILVTNKKTGAILDVVGLLPNEMNVYRGDRV